MTSAPLLTCPEQLAAVMARIYGEGLTTASGGNLSLLDRDGALWVTPSQVDKGTLGPEHMVRMAPDGSWSSATAGCKPTSEWPFHRAILQARPDCRAVAHAHPASLVAFSLAGQPLPLLHFPDLCRWVSQVASAPYATPGSSALGETLRPVFARGCDAALLDNHGVVTCGRDLPEAFHRLDVLEHLAGILLAGARLGALRPLNQACMREAQSRMEVGWEAMAVDVESQLALRTDLAEHIRRAHGRGLVGGRVGAFSCRCDRGFLVAPERGDNATLGPADLVYVAADRPSAAQAGKTPDAMASLHLALYQACAHVQAIATALPRHLMAFAATGTPFDARTIPEAYLLLKAVPTLPFPARFQGAWVAESLQKSPVALVENACVVVTGSSPFAVLDRLEVAELTARSLVDARALGRLSLLPDQVLDEITRTYG